MNFISIVCLRYFTFLTFASLDLVALTPNLACTLVTMRIILHMIFPFASSKIRSIRRRDVAVVPSLGLFFISSWLFSELRTKAYVERYRAHRTKD